VYQRARKSKRHRSAQVAVGAAQAAAIHPHTQQVREAAVQTVTGLAQANPQEVQRDNFKARLRQAINDATPRPKTEAEADKVMKQGGAKASESLRADLHAEQHAAAGPMEAAAKSEASASDQPAPPATELHVQPPGPAPAPVSPAPVVPAPLPAERLDYSADREPTDQAMTQADVTQQQLKKGNDPAFTPVLESRSTAEKHEAAAEGQYRKQERAVQEAGHAEAVTALTHGLRGIHAARAHRLGKVGGKQQDIKARDKLDRQEVTDRIAGIKNETKSQVDAVLKQIDDEAPKIFGRGLERAEKAYDAAFEDAKGGLGTWLTTWGSDWDELIENALGTAREEYMRQVDIAIDEVADFVDRKLHEAKDCVAAGFKRVDDFVGKLDKRLIHVGEVARNAVHGDFEAMTAQIDEHRDALVGKLAQQYKESYERMSAREEELREANKSLWKRVYDATVGLIKKIIAFKNMLLDVLARAAGVISEIIHDPIGFLGNLVDAVGLGLKNFISNIAEHLKKGIMEWIFGALSGAGLQLPDTFDLKGIVSIVLQILGLTYANFRARAVAIVGEPVVSALEQAANVFKIFMTQGVAGLWEFIKEKVSDLKSMVLDAIFDFIKEKVITAGITWIIGLLNPVSAFFKAIKAIYEIVMFFINHASEIVELVNAIINSVSAIVKGNITAAANWVENALAKIIPLAIGFLASLLGLGDPSKPVKETIEKARSPVNKAIDWVIHGAVKLVKAAGNLVKGVFGKKDKEKEAHHEDDPAKAAKIEAGIAHIHKMEQEHKKDGKLAYRDAEDIVTNTRDKHRVFTSLSVKHAGDHWLYIYTASAEQTITGAEAATEEVTVVKGTKIVLLGKQDDKKRGWPATVTDVVPGEYLLYEGPGGKRHTYNRGELALSGYKKTWRLVESPADEQVQEHHKIPWENVGHIQHRLRVLSNVNLKTDKRNLMMVGGHLSHHSDEYHEEVSLAMTRAYKNLKVKTQAAAFVAIGEVMDEIESRIANGTLKLYKDRDVWIP
jgi:A nuclease family of the HNH/ENDO VII superfamily with conserved AHH